MAFHCTMAQKTILHAIEFKQKILVNMTLPKVMRVFKDNVSTRTLLASTAKKAITM